MAAEWHIYLIRCADNSLYTGITTDVVRRLQEHQDGRGAKYLRGRGPLKLEFSCLIGDRAAASRAEMAVKRLSHTQKESLISGQINLFGHD